jgi:hypothetical protein
VSKTETTPETATPFVALRRHRDECYNFLSGLRDWSPECEDTHDRIPPDLAGREGSHEFSLIMLSAKAASDMKPMAPICYAEFYDDPSAPLIVLHEDGTDMMHMIFPRPSKALYHLARLMIDEMQAA